MKKHREIDDIIKELKNHPDYLHAEIFTWTQYLDDINVYLEDDELEPIQLEEINIELREKIVENIVDGFSISFESDFDFFPLLTRDSLNNQPIFQD